MPYQIIDRRLSGRHKSIANRERFLHRFRSHIKRAVAEAVRDRSIKDIEHAKHISIPRKDISEPVFQHGSGGKREMVHPGNEKYLKGDKVDRQKSGGRGSQASNEEGGEDDFAFRLSREEFMHYFFEDLELPHLTKTHLTAIPDVKNMRSGYASSGTPNNIHIVRSLRSALGRRIALGGPLRAELRELEEQLESPQGEQRPPGELKKMAATISDLKGRLQRIPFIDPFDLRYVNRVKQPQPSSQAVMFCIMDVSGSMDEQRKDLAKRFFILLYLFLTRNYEKIEVVFIRHHTRADEVSEDVFFHSTESGGTVVSSALELMDHIITERYDPGAWNIYAAQASDGDNWSSDSPQCRSLLAERILPRARYFAYIQVAAENQSLWDEYQTLSNDYAQFSMQKVISANDIYPVFRKLFEKRQ